MKPIRHLKVYGRGHCTHRIPEIILQGDWLASTGFKVSDKIEVICQEGRIVINNITE